MRHTDPALVSGDYVTLNPDDPDVFSFLRTEPNSGHSVLVALNMSSRNRTISFAESDVAGGRGAKGAVRVTVLKSSYPTSGSVKLEQVDIPAFGALVLGVE